MVAVKTNNYKLITAKALAPSLGAEIYGVDLRKPFPEDQFNEIKQAFQIIKFCSLKNNKKYHPNNMWHLGSSSEACMRIQQLQQ